MRTNLADRVIEFVLSRSDTELAALTVANIAIQLGCNRSHMSRAFKNEKSFTVEEFVFKIKIIRAAAMIKEDPSLTIKHVAGHMGFCRTDYFIRIFKKYFGTTPSKYRELLRNPPKPRVRIRD